MLPNFEWDQKQKHKKQPWSNVECFAFGGATVRFASLETSFHAANHTIPTPPSHEGSPHCPKDKNRSPFHGEKPLMIKWFLGKKPHQISQNDNQHFGLGRDILHPPTINITHSLIVVRYKHNYRIPPRITHSGPRLFHLKMLWIFNIHEY